MITQDLLAQLFALSGIAILPGKLLNERNEDFEKITCEVRGLFLEEEFSGARRCPELLLGKSANE